MTWCDQRVHMLAGATAPSHHIILIQYRQTRMKDPFHEIKTHDSRAQRGFFIASSTHLRRQ